MVYHGKVMNGRIILDGEARLPEGVAVRVDVIETSANGASGQRGTVWDRLLELSGKAEGLPADYSEQIDHYLYGTALPRHQGIEASSRRSAVAGHQGNGH